MQHGTGTGTGKKNKLTELNTKWTNNNILSKLSSKCK
jgi:hypothetical protein